MEKQYELIYTIVNQGYSDIVMQAAKENGARGGTIYLANGTGGKEYEKFYGIEISPEKEVIILSFASPGWIDLPLIFTSKDAALKFSTLMYFKAPPSTVYPYLDWIKLVVMCEAPIPISSSELKITSIGQCLTDGFWCKYSKSDVIIAIPALSSPPNNVVPSVTINSWPIHVLK